MKFKFTRVCIRLSLVLSVPMTAVAVERPNLNAVCDAWDSYMSKISDIESECKRANGDVLTLVNNVLSVDKSDMFTFEDKASMLKPTEFESDDEFNARVQKQKEIDANECERISKAKEEFVNQHQECIKELSEKCVELTNALKRAISERDNFKNMRWTYETIIETSDIPYFDRDTMSFKDISCPLVSYEDEGKRVCFKVESGHENISLKFGDIKCAQLFKEGVASGAIEMKFCYEFSVGDPNVCTFRAAWTEKKPNGFKKAGKLIGIAAMCARILNGSRGFYADDVARIEADDTYDLIEHPAVMGRSFPISVNKCHVVVKGEKAKLLGMKLDSLSKKWKLVVE